MPSMPKWYSDPKRVTVQVGVENIKRSPLGNEVVISYFISGNRKVAVVPTHFVNEAAGTIEAAEVGVLGNAVLISFPASSEGTATWIVPKDDLHELISS